MSPWVERVHGPPGTGKTTYLIDRVKEELAELPPELVGYYSYTNAAVDEGIARALEEFPALDREDFLHFRTIHSECCRLLRLTHEQVMAGKRLKEFGKLYGYEFSDFMDEEGPERHEVRERTLQTQGDYLLHFEDWRRARLFDTEVAYRHFPRPEYPVGQYWSLGLIRRFQQRYGDYKRENGFHDFTDMLMEVMENGLRPTVETLILDEAQDCSPLQYRVVDFWLDGGVERCYIGGDPHQAIHSWAGASPELFLDRRVDKDTLLEQSFRLPRQVHALAVRVIPEVPHYFPRPAEGYIRRCSLERAMRALEDSPGTAFLLVRNRCFLRRLYNMLLRWGIPFANLRGRSPFSGVEGDAGWKAYQLRRFRRGEPLAAPEIYRLFRDVPQKPYLERGVKAELKRVADEQPWRTWTLSSLRERFTDLFLSTVASEHYLSVLGIAPAEEAFFKRAIEKYGEEVLIRRPRVLLGTIHSVKGMEAEHVVALPDMTWRTHQGWKEDAAAEARVWYVLVTRAREGVMLVEPHEETHYRWPT